MIAVLKSDCFLVSQESNVIGCYNNTFFCYQINAEARTTHKWAALRRLYLFLGYSLHAGYPPPPFRVLKIANQNKVLSSQDSVEISGNEVQRLFLSANHREPT